MSTSSHKRFHKENMVRSPVPVATILKRASDDYFKKWCDAERQIKELELKLHNCESRLAAYIENPPQS